MIQITSEMIRTTQPGTIPLDTMNCRSETVQRQENKQCKGEGAGKIMLESEKMYLQLNGMKTALISKLKVMKQ